jgi:4-hydroxy 2-oxovalerate aldolase
VIDVTLRDGGCVNGFDFGERDMSNILNGLAQSNVDYIELGYIDEINGSECGRTQFINEQVIPAHFLKNKTTGTFYVAMIDYGKFNFNSLKQHTNADIDGIRLAFHKKNCADITSIGKIILQKGYQFFIQPMITLRYSDSELLELIDMVNRELPDASGFYIVDSFGEMRHNDVIRALNLVDHNLRAEMPIGFHSHNNLQMSYANAISVMQFPSKRDLFLDSSVMGMGKGAGNLNTELLLEHLNLYYDGQYAITPLLNIMDTVLNKIKSEFYWGYSAEYYLSAVNHCTPSYAQHFQQKQMLPIEQIAELLGKIEENKKISFDKSYADIVYRDYISRNVDDKKVVTKLFELFSGKKVLMLAPGRSCETEKNKIADYLKNNQVVVISVNIPSESIPSDYIFIANNRRYKLFCENTNKIQAKPLICTSNIKTEPEENVYIINYADYLCVDLEIESNTGMMALNLMYKLKVREVILAGFDGLGINKYTKNVKNDPVTFAECEKRNLAIGAYIRKMSERIKVSFLTRSMYESQKTEEL